MPRTISSLRPRHSTVVAYLALLVALGGTSYAAVSLPKNSVGSPQIKRNAVASSEVKNGSLTQADFNKSSVPVGPAGPQGPQGAKGADGTADIFARVQTDGTLQPDVPGFASQHKGIVNANIVKGEGGAATGTYCFNIDGTVASALVSLDNADAAAAGRNLVVSVAIDRGEDLGDCPPTHNDARVRIVDGTTEVATDARFFVWFEK
jgi:hypothetical protein